MKSRLLLLILLCVWVLSLSACSQGRWEGDISTIQLPREAKVASYVTRSGEQLEDFVNEYMTTPDGIRTNLVDRNRSRVLNGGDVLSESIGLQLLYYYETNQKTAFNELVGTTRKRFMNKNGLFAWRLAQSDSAYSEVNATIDDLRIAKALILAGRSWGNEDYIEYAKDLSGRLLEHCTEGNNLLSFDNPDSPLAPWVYYDFEAMYLLGQFDQKWIKIMKESLVDIQSDQIPGYPFFEGAIQSDESGYPATENLLIVLHLSQIGVDINKEEKWLIDQMKQGAVLGWYDQNGEPISTVESPSIYGIVSQIAQCTQNSELYALATSRLKTLQVKETHLYHGGFVDVRTHEAYSFDQLMALLGFLRWEYE